MQCWKRSMWPMTLLLAMSATAVAQSAPVDCADLAARVRDSVVAVEIEAGEDDIYLGSGFFVDTKGTVLTNWHVVQPEGKVFIYWDTDWKTTRVEMKPGPSDEDLDLAILVPLEKLTSKPLSLAPTDRLKTGRAVAVVGFPDLAQMGEERDLSIFAGIVTTVHDDDEDCVYGFLTDASILGGNSGGPILDRATGQVLGVAQEAWAEPGVADDPETGEPREPEDGEGGMTWGLLGSGIPCNVVLEFLEEHEVLPGEKKTPEPPKKEEPPPKKEEPPPKKEEPPKEK